MAQSGIGKPILAQCAALRVLSNNENRTAINSFSNGWVIYHWIRHFQVFPYPLHIWNRKWNRHRWNFFVRFGFPDYWMDGAYYAPNPKKRRSKLWTWSTNVTHRQTHRADRSNTQIHSWMNLRKKNELSFSFNWDANVFFSNSKSKT
jgi:hypothetical protein